MTKQQKKDVRRGLRRYGRAMEAAEGTPDGDRLDMLATLAEAYEERRWPVDELDPVAAIEAERGLPGNRLYYLAIPPSGIGDAARRLAQHAGSA